MLQRNNGSQSNNAQVPIWSKFDFFAPMRYYIHANSINCIVIHGGYQPQELHIDHNLRHSLSATFDVAALPLGRGDRPCE